ncbi:MAG: hypothetical protein KDA05_06910 [Phycisphaerales bacterium]|nr:hypothetical protein [Phycisphaerales bacterium]MCB9840540.1 hypothetical protein [Phycisphaeraceae bacterium]
MPACRRTTTPNPTPPSPRGSNAGRGLVALVALAGLAGAASAQNNLGSGYSLYRPLERPQARPGAVTGNDGYGLNRSLERDLGRGVPSLGPNTAANFNRQLAIRNAIVTGNAPNGASFRGDVGYIAPNDFRGELGSNDLFAFRRDSLFSGFAGMGIRGTEALQYQMALTTGNPSGMLGSGAAIVQRSGGGVGPQATGLGVPGTGVQTPGVRQPASVTPGTTAPGTETPPASADPYALGGGTLMGMLRTPSAYTVNRGIQPEMLAQMANPNTGEAWGLTASPLRGVRLDALMSAEVRRPGAAPSGAADTGAVTPGQPTTALGPGTDARPDSTVVPNSYQAMVNRFMDLATGRGTPGASETPGTQSPGAPPVAATPGTSPGTAPAFMAPGSEEWEQRLAEIRERLSQDLARPEVLRESRANLQRGEFDPGEGPASDNRTPGLNTFRPLDPEALRIIRESGLRLDQYVPLDNRESVYAQHMAVAAQFLSRRAYFDAEERFTRALDIRRGDWMAGVGRLHAQLGAGMYLSAGTNLRNMLTEHPEVAAATYDAAMLPAPDRLDEIAQELRTNISGALEGQRALLGTDSALLLAYLGFQRGDEAMLHEGLDLYQRLLDRYAPTPAGEGGAAPPAQHGAALLEMVRGVWAGQIGTGDPASPPATPETGQP